MANNIPVTTIKLHKPTLELLKQYKLTPRESYQEMILRLIKEVEALQNKYEPDGAN